MSTHHAGGKALFDKRQLENLPCTVKLSSRGAAEEEEASASKSQYMYESIFTCQREFE